MADKFRKDDLIQTKAKVFGWSPESVIGEIESIRLYDPVFFQWCRSVKAELVPELSKVMVERRGAARLNASLLLLNLGEPDGTDGIIACLQEADPPFQIAILTQLSIRALLRDGSWMPLPVKNEALFAALEPLLETPGEGEPSVRERIHHLALEVALKLDLPEAYERLLPLLRSGSAEVRSTLLRQLARRGEDRGALDTAEELLNAGVEVYWVISALETYAEGNDPVLAQRAADLLVTFVRANLTRPGNDVTNLLWHALNGILAAEHPEQEEVLKQVLDGPIKDWRRGEALSHLAALEGENSISRLHRALADSKLRRYAATAISKNPPMSDNAGLAKALIAAARQESDEHVIRRIVEALVSLRADLGDIPEAVRRRLDPITAMRVHWLTNGITARAAVELFVETGVISPPTEDQLQELNAEWVQEQSAYGTIGYLLERRMAWFDTESGFIPPKYLDLLSQLFTISHPNFQPEAPAQTYDEGSGESEIRFVYKNKQYTFTARAYGDYYDLSSVLAGLNLALADGGNEERFLSLYTGDQTATVIFVPEEPFLHVAHILQIPFEQDQWATRG